MQVSKKLLLRNKRAKVNPDKMRDAAKRLGVELPKTRGEAATAELLGALRIELQKRLANVDEKKHIECTRCFEISTPDLPCCPYCGDPGEPTEEAARIAAAKNRREMEEADREYEAAEKAQKAAAKTRAASEDTDDDSEAEEDDVEADADGDIEDDDAVEEESGTDEAAESDDETEAVVEDSEGSEGEAESEGDADEADEPEDDDEAADDADEAEEAVEEDEEPEEKVKVVKGKKKAVVAAKAAKPAKPTKKEPGVGIAKKGGAAIAKNVDAALAKQEKELDSAIARIVSLKKDYVGLTYDVGVELKNIRDKQLYKARGYTSFKLFAEKELQFKRESALQLIALVEKNTKEDYEAVGYTKLRALAVVTDPATKEEILEVARKGASTKEVKERVKQAAAAGVTTSKKPVKEAPEKGPRITLLGKIGARAQIVRFTDLHSGEQVDSVGTFSAKGLKNEVYGDLEISEGIYCRIGLRINKQNELEGATVRFVRAEAEE